MYVISTDAVGHLYGPPAQAAFMRALDNRLKLLREHERDRPFYVVMFSDHGMAGGKPLVNTWPAIKSATEHAGYTIRNKLDEARDVVFIPYGLLSSFVVYSQMPERLSVARAITQADGVDLCVMRDGDRFHVISGRGQARIERRNHNARQQFAYYPDQGDPLQYSDVRSKLAKSVSPADAMWFDDSAWFTATKNHFYPDALYRISRAFDLVRNPGSLVCSVSPDYMFGGLLTEYVAIPTIGRLRWTHGALHREASLGFFMTDLPQWPAADAMRYDTALAPLQKRFGQFSAKQHSH